MRITLDNLNKGNKNAVYSGKKSKGNPNPQPKTLRYERPKTRSKTKLNEESIEIAEFQANNTDMRGKKDRLEFRGNHPHKWNPKLQFQQGFTDDGGDSKGGQPGVKKGGKNDYVKPYGNLKSTTRPFSSGKVESYVRLKVK